MLIIFLFLQSETTFKYIYLYFHLQILTERIYIFTMSDKNWEICCTKRDNIQAMHNASISRISKQIYKLLSYESNTSLARSSWNHIKANLWWDVIYNLLFKRLQDAKKPFSFLKFDWEMTKSSNCYNFRNKYNV